MGTCKHMVLFQENDYFCISREIFLREIKMSDFQCEYWKISVIQLNNKLHKPDNTFLEDHITYELYNPPIFSSNFQIKVLLLIEFSECYHYRERTRS